MRRVRVLVLASCLSLVACAELKTSKPQAEEEPAPKTASEPSTPAPTPGTPTTPPPTSSTPPTPPPGTHPSPKTGASVDTICAGLCDWRDRCPGTPPSSHLDCVSNCRDEWSGRAPHLRPNYVIAVGACFQTLSCAKTDDACFNNFFAADPDPANVPAVKACMSAAASCDDPKIGADTCYFLSACDDATRAASAACVTGTATCREILDCLHDARGD
jgi:hypothetical protein